MTTPQHQAIAKQLRADLIEIEAQREQIGSGQGAPAGFSEQVRDTLNRTRIGVDLNPTRNLPSADEIKTLMGRVPKKDWSAKDAALVDELATLVQRTIDALQ